MLVVVVAAIAVARLACFKFSSSTATLLLGMVFASVPTVVVGTWAGYYIKDTKNGRAAIAVGCAAVIAFSLIILLLVLLGHS